MNEKALQYCQKSAMHIKESFISCLSSKDIRHRTRVHVNRAIIGARQPQTQHF